MVMSQISDREDRTVTETATAPQGDLATDRPPNRTGTLVWHEFQVPDLTAAKEFYSAVFGWTYQPFGESFVICQNPDGQMVAGLDEVAAEPAGRHVRVYVESDDLEAALDRVAAAGGTVVHPRRVISEEFGWFALVTDPSGLTFGLSTSHPAAG
jgi:predicted enzyme related to lactoylglutathione lyase